MPDSPGPYQLDHVAVGVPAVADVTPLVVGALGGRPLAAGPGMGFGWWQWQFAGGGVLEVLEPEGPPGGFLHRFLDARGPGVHHATFKVPELRAAADRAERFGYQVVGYEDRFPGWKECFLHPKQAQGIVVQLAESHPELEDPAEGRDFPAAPEPASPARVLGVRLAASDAARGRRQWGELLGGEESAEGDALVFRWPDSPLRVAVEVRPDAAEGPIALEIAQTDGLALPSGPHPALGVPLVHAPV